VRFSLTHSPSVAAGLREFGIFSFFALVQGLSEKRTCADFGGRCIYYHPAGRQGSASGADPSRRQPASVRSQLANPRAPSIRLKVLRSSAPNRRASKRRAAAPPARAANTTPASSVALGGRRVLTTTLRILCELAGNECYGKCGRRITPRRQRVRLVGCLDVDRYI
jgi:hypothetical protein